MTNKCATLFMAIATVVAAVASSQARDIIKFRKASNDKAQQAFAKPYKKGKASERINAYDMVLIPGIA